MDAERVRKKLDRQNGGTEDFMKISIAERADRMVLYERETSITYFLDKKRTYLGKPENKLRRS